MPRARTEELSKRLESEIEATHEFLANLKLRSEHYVHDRIVFGFVWTALAAAEVIAICVREGHQSGLYPSLRQLFETLVDLSYMVLQDDHDSAAFAVALGEIKSAKAQRESALEVERLLTGKKIDVEPSDLDKTLEELAEDLREFATINGMNAESATESVEAALRLAQGKGTWHWSRRSFDDRVQWITNRDGLGDDSKGILVTLKKVFASRSHSTPLFLDLVPERDEQGTHHYLDTREFDDSEASMLVGPAAGVLQMTREIARAATTDD